MKRTIIRLGLYQLEKPDDKHFQANWGKILRTLFLWPGLAKRTAKNFSLLGLLVTISHEMNIFFRHIEDANLSVKKIRPGR